MSTGKININTKGWITISGKKNSDTAVSVIKQILINGGEDEGSLDIVLFPNVFYKD